MHISRSLNKNIIREIRSTLGRFIAIFAISALGAGFFAGLRATSPDMQLTADRYYERQRLADVTMLSTLGFSQADVQAVAALPGVEGLMAGWGLDLLVQAADGTEVAHFAALPENMDENNPAWLDRPVLTEGRLPAAAGECVADAASRYKLGDVLPLAAENDEASMDFLAGDSFTVVGRANSPRYVSFTRGNTNIGNGSVDYFVLLHPSAFDSEIYTELALTIRDAAALSAFSDEYTARMENEKAALEALGKERGPMRYDEVYAEAEAELADAKREVTEGWETLRAELADAWQEITDGAAKVADGKTELEENRQKLVDARQAIVDGRREIADGEQALRDGQVAWQQGWDAWRAGADRLDAQRAAYNAARANLDAGWQGAGQIDALLAQIGQMTGGGMPIDDPAVSGMLQAAQAALQTAAGSLAAGGVDTTALDAAIGAMQAGGNNADKLAAGQTAAGVLRATLGAVEAQLAGVPAALQAGQEQVWAAYVQLDNARLDIVANEQKLADTRAALRDAQAEVADGEQKLADAETELADAEAELADGRRAYYKEKGKAEQELVDAETDIAAAQRDLNALEPAEWYVRTREDNPGYSGFASDTSRIDAIAVVIPVFFFLVAALVCLTTMTRMVEEQRGLIGTLKALGYSGGSIAFKYLFYAAFASTTGAVLGVLVGFWAFPTAIWQAYGIMYLMPKLSYGSNMGLAVASVLACVLCTTLATLAACLNELRSAPAGLMRPKAPKAGKRVLLERVGFVWRRMSFMAKVTVRNLFRYKKRFLMTVIGVAGCTALLLTGFGLNDSISGIVPRQYGGIYLYDVMAALDSPADSMMESTLNETLPALGEGLYVHQINIGASAGDESNRDMTVNLFVAEQPERLPAYIDFHDRKTGAAVAAPVDSGAEPAGAVITEKLALRLKLEVGDEMTIQLTGEPEGKVRVAGVMENYLLNTVYVTPGTYQAMFGKAPEYDTLLLNLTPDADTDAVLTALVDTEGVAGAVDVKAMMREFTDMFDSLNAVVWLIILAAGLLAFVVLYNLTNINITERAREIATLKVLGFYNGEVASYIYRENLLLTLIGAAFGLVLGVFLHQFVIQTAEIDEVMFRRTVEPLSYLLSVAFTLLSAMFVNLVMLPRLRSVDMVESLKSAE